MRQFERFFVRLRHHHLLGRASWLWDFLRPFYEGIIAFVGRNGLPRHINGSDLVLVSPELRQIPETYETEYWQHLMARVKPGDVIADIGAYVGLYAVALAKRVGPSGKVFAFEPDKNNFEQLATLVHLNKVEAQVELIEAAVGSDDGAVQFEAAKDSESHISSVHRAGLPTVRCVRLDTYWGERPLDIVKIDVEGYEERVLQGAAGLLGRAIGSPRLLYIEVHPFAWSGVGTSSQSLLDLLKEYNYKVYNVKNEPVDSLHSWDHIVAVKMPADSFTS